MRVFDPMRGEWIDPELPTSAPNDPRKNAMGGIVNSNAQAFQFDSFFSTTNFTAGLAAGQSGTLEIISPADNARGIVVREALLSAYTQSYPLIGGFIASRDDLSGIIKNSDLSGHYSVLTSAEYTSLMIDSANGFAWMASFAKLVEIMIPPNLGLYAFGGFFGVASQPVISLHCSALYQKK